MGDKEALLGLIQELGLCSCLHIITLERERERERGREREGEGERGREREREREIERESTESAANITCLVYTSPS